MQPLEISPSEPREEECPREADSYEVDPLDASAGESNPIHEIPSSQTEDRLSDAQVILVVDDVEQDRNLLAGIVRSFGYAVETAANGIEALRKLDTTPVAAIITDLMMPGMDGCDLLRALGDRSELTPTIVLTTLADVGHAVTVVHELHAFWYLEKPAQVTVLRSLLERAIAYGDLLKGTERLRRELSQQGVLDQMVGASRCMQQAYALIQRAAPSQASVLITGESGTGKEMAARAIHRLSRRSGGPFVAVNCAAVPSGLIESELFGHEKGSFTGALGRHAGCFEQAHRGTLFLDEIGEMPQPMQARLLRALEESKVRRVGGSADIAVDVRILAATNRTMDNGERVLREDLFYRLNVFHIHLAPLRERKEDILQISKSLIDGLNEKHGCSVTTLHSDALQRLTAHSWPGNVRELRNVLEWAVITAQSGLIRLAHLPRNLAAAPVAAARPAAQAATVGGSAAAGAGIRFELGRSLDDVKNEYLIETLKSVGHDRQRAAQILGVSLRTMYNRLSEAKRGSEVEA